MQQDKKPAALSAEEVQKIAFLARLKLDGSEVEQYARQLNDMLGYFNQISTIDTTGIEPLVTPSDIEMVWRADETHREQTTAEIVANAPQKTGNLFTVPPVV